MKRIINNKIVIGTPILALFSLCACKKFIVVPPPQTQIITASVFASNATATAAMTVVYAQMNQSSITYYIPYLTGLSGDELKNYTTFQDFVSFYTNSLNAAIVYVGSHFWTPPYNYIYEANAMIAGLQGSNSISPAVKKQLTGEALFIRAFWHFYLTNLFGDVPLVTTTDYTITATEARTPQADVYRQIIADLKIAQAYLNTNFVDASDTTVTTERVRPTQWAATALLARAYLYEGSLTGSISDYDSAEAQATAVINNSAMFSLVTDLNSVFLKNSKEAIWQLQPASNGYSMNTMEGAYFILTTPPNNGSGGQNSTLSPQLLAAFEPGDKRMADWTDTIMSVNGTDTTIYYFPYKYRAAKSATTTSEYEMVLRLAEQYLVRAEARAQQGNTTGALADLNAIRNRAGLSDYSGATDKTTLLTAILHERQVELFTEWGHRWLDLKRTGNVNSVMSVVTLLKGGTWSSNWALYPIPQTERTNDPNLSQNMGYN